MKHLSIKLIAETPLAIRSDHAPGGVETATFITGTTLLGSLANVHRLLYSEKTEEFEALFLSGQVHYPDLYPAAFPDQKMQESRLPVYPLPKTAQSCKRFSGFRYIFPGERKQEKQRHGVRDSLIDWSVFNLLDKNEVSDNKIREDEVEDKRSIAALQVLRQHKLCPVCGAAMDHFAGYYRRETSDPFNMISAHIEEHTRVQTHTGINRRTGTVEESILYSRQVFEENMQFWGTLMLPDELASTFTEFIEQANAERLIRVGTGRTRGLGKVDLSLGLVDPDEQDRLSAFTERVERFNQKLYDRARVFGLNDFTALYFALTIHSPLILCDPLLRYRGTVNEETLSELTDLPASTFHRIYQSASIRRVMGWSDLWGTPKTNEFAIETGSVFLFSCPSDAKDAVLRSLFTLEERGVGKRRNEGFGRICVSDTFHQEGDLR